MGTAIVLGVFTLISSIGISSFLKTRAEKLFPFSFLLISCFLYVFGLFDLLNVGKILLLVFVIIIFCYSVRTFGKQLINSFASWETLAWIAMVIIVAFYQQGKTLHVHDEFSHWGTVVKQIYYTGRLHSVDSSMVWFKEYPPAIALVQWFSISFFPTFSEDSLYITYSIMSISFLLIPISFIKDTKPIYKITCIVLLLLLPLAWGNHTYYSSILADNMMEILTAYLFFVYFAEDNRKAKAFILATGLFVLAQIKPAAIALCAFVLIVIAIDMMINKRRNNDSGLFIFLAIITTLSKVSWLLFLKVHDVTLNNSSLDITKTLEYFSRLFSGSLTQIETQALKDIINGFFVPKFKTFPFTLSPAIWMAFLFIPVLLCFGKERKRFVVFYIVSSVFLLVWVFGTMLVWIVQFSQPEDVSASFLRYIPSVMGAIILSFVMILTVKNSRSVYCIAICVGGTLALTVPTRASHFFQPVTQKKEILAERVIYEYDKLIVDKAIHDGDKVFLLYQNEEYPSSATMMGRAYYYYALTPRNVSYEWDDFWNDEGKLFSEEDIRTKLITINPDWVFVSMLKEENVKFFSDIFHCDVVPYTYYRMSIKDDKIYLTPSGTEKDL